MISVHKIGFICILNASQVNVSLHRITSFRAVRKYKLAIMLLNKWVRHIISIFTQTSILLFMGMILKLLHYLFIMTCLFLIFVLSGVLSVIPFCKLLLKESTFKYHVIYNYDVWYFLDTLFASLADSNDFFYCVRNDSKTRQFMQMLLHVFIIEQ